MRLVPSLIGSLLFSSCMIGSHGPEPTFPNAPIEITPAESVLTYRFAGLETWAFDGSLPEMNAENEVSFTTGLDTAWSGGFASTPRYHPGWSEPMWDFDIPRVLPLLEWQDSLSDTMLTGGARIVTRIVREGAVSDWGVDGDSTLTIRIEAAVSWAGTGVLRQGFRLSGTGTESRTLQIDRGGILRQLVARRFVSGTLDSEDLDDLLRFTVTRTDSVTSTSPR